MRSILTILFALILLAGCSKEIMKPAAIEFRLAETSPADSLIEYSIDNRETFYLHPTVLMDNSVLVDANVEDYLDGKAIGVKFNEEGKEILARVTGENIGKHMAILIDGELVTAPKIQAQIPNGVALINGNFSDKEAERIAENLIKMGK